MKKLILLVPLLLLTAPVPGHSQGVQMPNADNAAPPPSLDSPELKSVKSHPPRAAHHQPRRPLRRHHPSVTQSQSSLGSTAVPQLG